jgi:hypothetical protein
VRKKLGLTLVSEKTGTERVYRIAVKTPARKVTVRTAPIMDVIGRTWRARAGRPVREPN